MEYKATVIVAKKHHVTWTYPATKGIHNVAIIKSDMKCYLALELNMARALQYLYSQISVLWAPILNKIR
jgi:hypothetical protein